MNINNNATTLEVEVEQQKNLKGGKGKMAFLFQKRMKLWGNEKGLTLIELLAVIVILAIISAIAIPAIGSIISGSKDKATSANGLMVISAARYAYINEDPTLPKNYSLADLKTGGYLESYPADPLAKGTTYKTDTSIVTISKVGTLITYTVTLYDSTGLIKRIDAKTESDLNN